MQSRRTFLSRLAALPFVGVLASFIRPAPAKGGMPRIGDTFPASRQWRLVGHHVEPIQPGQKFVSVECHYRKVEVR